MRFSFAIAHLILSFPTIRAITIPVPDLKSVQTGPLFSNSTPPSNTTDTPLSNTTTPLTPNPTILQRKHSLRVLPLGDSLTYGFASSDNNGYRRIFYDLGSQGGKIEMIGSHKGLGVMEQNSNEGWNAYTIAQITEKATKSLPKNPNIILLLAGTNDIGSDNDAVAAPARMAALLAKIAETTPNAAVLLSTIPPSADPTRQLRNDAYNAQLTTLVQTQRHRKGQKILLVNIDQAVLPTQLIDGIHPTDEGYRNMALAWLAGVEEVEKRGWIDAPIPEDGLALNIILAIAFAAVIVFGLAVPIAVCCLRQKSWKRSKYGFALGGII
ncbi:SGNH hydrolase [Tothia fuscella]|uniref:SGNH hydrolase n=1 Tax=Tothia fuscella TaxID=1048955 RepID=A0A9P4P1Y4_9PEZI|nr:SGNH hydrolase [Tothia fuscella]